MPGQVTRIALRRSPLPGRVLSPPGPIFAAAGLVLVFLTAAPWGDLSAAAKAKAAGGADPGPGAVSSPEAFAGVYLDRFLKPRKELLLKPEGTERSRSLARYYLGLLKEDRGDLPGATRFYSEVLENDSSALALAERTAYLCAREGRVEEGRAILEKALENNPGAVRCYLSLSDYVASYLTGDSARDDSIRILHEALEKFPNNTRVIDSLVQAYLAFNMNRDAEDCVNQALAQDINRPQYWLQMGKIAQHIWPVSDAGDPAKINQIYEKALSFAPEDAAIAEAVADYFNASEQFPRAADIYRDIIERHPDCITPREKLARIYALNEDTGKVIEILSELVELHPERAETQKFLARIYEDEKRFDEAIKHYEQALRIGQGTITDYFYAARLMLEVQRFQDAVDLLERARFHYRESEDLNRLLAFAYSFNKQYEKALHAFEETISIAGEGDASSLNEGFYFQYAATCERLKDYDQAADLFRKALALVPEDHPEDAAKSHNYLGYMWLEQDMNIAEAGKHILKANELRPETGAYIDSLGWYYFKAGEYEKAIQALKHAVELIDDGEHVLNADDAVIFDHIAQTYFAQGNKAQAIENIRKSIELDPENADYRKRLEEFRKDEKGAEKGASGAEDGR